MKEKKETTKTKIINVFSRRIGAVFLVAAMAGSLCAPIVTLVPEAKTVKTTAKKLKNSTIYVGSSKTVSVSSKSKVKWTTSNRKVAFVKSASKAKAKITAKNTGTATITGKAGRTKWTMKVSVKRKGSTTKTVKLKAVSLTVGKSKTVTANTKSKVLWSSSNKAVAAVKSAGKNKAKVTAKKAGTAIVTGKAGKTKWTAKVTVKKKSTGGSTKNTADNTLDTTLLDKNIKTMLHSIGADTATSDIQKFARLCHWWTQNVTYGNYYKNSEAVMNKYGKGYKIEDDYNGCISAAYILETKAGVCGPQAEAFKYFGDLIGLKSVTIFNSSDNHEWLHVYLDDGWYEFDPTFICINPDNKNNEPTSPCITYNEYINGTEKSKYNSLLANAKYLYPDGTTNSKGQTAEEIVKEKMYIRYKTHTYRVAKIYHEKSGEYYSAGANCNNPSEHYGNKDKRDGPYFFEHTGKGYDTGTIGEKLDGQKYIDVILADYL